MEEGTVPSNWADIVSYSSELVSTQDYQLAVTWLNNSISNPNSNPEDNPVLDPFAIVTDHHKQGNKKSKKSWSISTKELVAATANDVAKSMADSEGEHSNNPSQSKHVMSSANTVHANTQRDSGGMEAVLEF